MWNSILQAIGLGSLVVDPNAPKANKAGPDYRAPFSFEN